MRRREEEEEEEEEDVQEINYTKRREVFELTRMYVRT